MSQRIIKFRCWTGKEMVHWTDLVGQELYRLNSEIVHYMQYTGLKDKNGKEIFEGDIVGIRNPEYIGGFSDKEEVHFGSEVEDDYGDRVLGYYVYNNNYEIIGNIYEGLHSGEKTGNGGSIKIQT